ncbi:MAG TPA: hypothetical protein VIQ00_00075 [Chitinophagaceae bacterium]
MKTVLPEKITTIAEAKSFLTDLFNNNEGYHPEDDAKDIFTNDVDEAEKLNGLMQDIYNLEGNQNYPKNMVFDPCKFLLDLFFSKNDI